MNKFVLSLLFLAGIMACGDKKEVGKKNYDSSQSASESKGNQVEHFGINIGEIAPEISLPSPDGKMIKLSSLRGKYVLIDFWASWCGPCRMENPNVVKTYNLYKNKGLEIYGVSLDKNKDQWIKAINQDGITWIQVSDLGWWNSVVVPLYNISGIPHTVLLDKEGKIIAKDLRGQELEDKLKSVLK